MNECVYVCTYVCMYLCVEISVKTKIKQLAKKGEIGSVKILAKEIVATRKTKERMHTAKAQVI